MKILHVDSSVLGGNSVSRHLSAAIVARLTAASPGATVTYRDLAADPVAHTSPALVAAAYAAPGTHDAAIQRALADASSVLDEFMSADAVVIGAPMYNFGVPSQLKAWLDKLCVAGKSFRYGPNGPEGLAGGRRVFVASARGGAYAPGTPMAAFDHQETHLRALLGFIGVTDLTVVRAEGVASGPEARAAAITGAEQQIAQIAA